MSTINVVNYIVEIVPVGEQGQAGQGVPAGGTAEQVLKKNSNASYDTYWSNGAGAVDSVNGKVGIIVLDADDVGAYSNTNPNGFQNVSQVVSYANVISVNGYSGVVVLDADDVGAYSNTNPNGYQNVTQVVSYANVINVNGQSGVVNVYPGGTTNQILAKNSSTNGDASWTSNINIDTATFSTTVNATPGIAKLSWNFEEKTLEFGKTADTVLQLGQETLYPLVYNADSVTLTRGTVVMVDPADPAQGNKLRVKRMVADGSLPAKLLVGLVTEDFAAGADGFVTWFGLNRGISISAKQPGGETWAEGDILWCNPAVAGGLTKVEPTAPNLKVSVCAIVSINGGNANVLVRPWLSDDLKDLHDVNVTNVISNQAILWNAVSNTWTASNVVRTLTGDGVDNTNPQEPTLTFPTIDQIGAYSNTNPAGYQNVSQVQAFANVVSVNGQSGIVVLDADDIGAYANTNPSGYQNISQVQAYANVISVNGQSGVAVLGLDDLSNVNVSVANTGDVLKYNATTNTWSAGVGGGAVDSVNGQTGVVILNMDDINNVQATNATEGQYLIYNANASAWQAKSVSAGGVQSVSGDGVDNTDPQNPVISFPTLNEIGAYSNTNPKGYQNVSQVVAYANVVSVNSQSGVVILDADDVGAYANTNPAGYQNVTQVTSYANVVSVNGQSGVVVLDADDVGAYANTNPAGYQNVTQVVSYANVVSVNGYSGIVVLDADDVGAYSNTNPDNYVNATGAASAAPVQSVTGTLVTGTSADPVINIPTLDQVGAYSNTNPAGYQNVSQVVSYANVVSVNGQSGIVVLDADDVGAYANTNPAGYQNVTQVVAYANVVSVNGKSGVVVLDVNDIGAYANTNPSGYQNVSQVVSYANVINVNGQSGIVSLALDNLSDVDAPTPTSGYVLTYNGTATAWKAEAAQGGTATVDMGQVILNSQVFS